MEAPDSNWFADESLWEALYPFAFMADRFAAADGEVGQLARLVHLHSGSVLDVGCGPGRHAVAFARRGFSVTGVDRSAFLLRKAAERALAQQVQVEWG